MDNRIGMINYLDYNYSKAKGETKEGQTFNSALLKNASDPEYSTNLVTNEAVTLTGSTDDATYTGTLSWKPVLDDSVSIDVNGTTYTATVTDKAAGVISVVVTATGTVSFGTVSAYYFDNESVQSDTYGNGWGSNVPEVELKMNSIPVEARARTLRSYWAFDAQYELQKEYGQDIETLLATQVTGELAHEIDTELTLDLLKAAKPNGVWSKAITPGISLVDHYDSFAAKLVEDSNKIFEMTRKVKANFLICGLEVASVIEVMRGFTSAGKTAVGPHLLGTLNGIKVFVNPDYPAKEYVLGYKGSNMFD